MGSTSSSVGNHRRHHRPALPWWQSRPPAAPASDPCCRGGSRGCRVLLTLVADEPPWRRPASPRPSAVGRRCLAVRPGGIRCRASLPPGGIHRRLWAGSTAAPRIQAGIRPIRRDPSPRRAGTASVWLRPALPSPPDRIRPAPPHRRTLSPFLCLLPLSHGLLDRGRERWQEIRG